MLLKQIPVCFLNFDEAISFENFKFLRQSVPEAVSIRGIKGFDAVHQEAMKASAGDWFITVDADCKVHPDFWNFNYEPSDTKSKTWKSLNIGNGLTYGNGGVKLWHKSFFETHSGHENNPSKLDFCYDNNYVNYSAVVSTTNPYFENAIAHRSGFREGVKLLLKNGNAYDTLNILDPNLPGSAVLSWVQSWCCLGNHLESGVHAQLGALRALYYVHLTKRIPATCVSSYEETAKALDTIYKLEANLDIIINAGNLVRDYREKISVKTGWYLPNFGPKQSEFIVSSKIRSTFMPQNIFSYESYSRLPL